MNVLLVLSISLLTGLLIAKLLGFFKLPSVTGYLVAGLILGPTVFNIIPTDICTDLEYISEIALGIIAFNIGGQFETNYIKKLGKEVIIITLFQALITVFIVLIVFYIITGDTAYSLLLGAISAATAPAATLLVMKEYNTKGPLTDTLLAVVALDDMVCILVFSISAAIARILLAGTFNLKEALIIPLEEIIVSILLGLLLSYIIIIFTRLLKKSGELLVLIIGAILLSAGIAQVFNLSILLTCMSFGAGIANFLPGNKRLFRESEKITPVIYVLFFTFAGISLDLHILKRIGLLGIIYILSRAFGKIIGSYLGGVASRSPDIVKKYLGFGMLPQAGVAIGLAMIVTLEFPEFGTDLSNIIMGAVFVYEIIGPILTRFILTKAGETNIQGVRKPRFSRAK